MAFAHEDLILAGHPFHDECFKLRIELRCRREVDPRREPTRDRILVRGLRDHPP